MLIHCSVDHFPSNIREFVLVAWPILNPLQKDKTLSSSGRYQVQIFFYSSSSNICYLWWSSPSLKSFCGAERVVGYSIVFPHLISSKVLCEAVLTSESWSVSFETFTSRVQNPNLNTTELSRGSELKNQTVLQATSQDLHQQSFRWPLLVPTACNHTLTCGSAPRHTHMNGVQICAHTHIPTQTHTGHIHTHFGVSANTLFSTLVTWCCF